MNGLPYGDFDEPHAEIFETGTYSRRRARREFGLGCCHIHVRVRYARWLTLQESWEGGNTRSSWSERQIEDREDVTYDPGLEAYVDAAGEVLVIPLPPEVAPDDFEPDEYDPAWGFCEASHPMAVRVWSCECGASRRERFQKLMRRVRWRIRRRRRRWGL